MTQALRPSDRRAFGRRDTSLHAMARIAGRASEPCIVRDMSDGGAKLEFHEAVTPPEKFRLVIEAKGFEADCHVRRRMGNLIGVSFATSATGPDFGLGVSTAPAADPAPAQAASAPVVHPSPSRRLVLVVPGHEMRSKLFG